MTYEQVHNAIRSRFKTQVADVHALVAVYDNDPSPPPADGSRWCRFRVLDGASRRLTCGVKEYRLVGLAVAHLFSPVGHGDAGLLRLADAIVAAFRGATADGIRYGDAYAEPVGIVQDCYQVNVVCPWTADHQES